MPVLDKEKYFYTTNFNLKKYLQILGFSYDISTTEKDRELYVFEKSDSLIETLNFYFTKKHQNKSNDKLS